jgi:hypothetical protein
MIDSGFGSCHAETSSYRNEIEPVRSSCPFERLLGSTSRLGASKAAFWSDERRIENEGLAIHHQEGHLS